MVGVVCVDVMGIVSLRFSSNIRLPQKCGIASSICLGCLGFLMGMLRGS